MIIKTFKLVSGEEIITEVEEVAEGTLKFVKPRVLAPVQDNHGHFTIMLMPWLLCDPSGSIDVGKDKIMGEVVSVLPKVLEDDYLSQVSGINLVK